MKYRLLAALSFSALAFLMTAQAQELVKSVKKDRPGSPEIKDNSKANVDAVAIRQAQMKRLFESVRNRLSTLANRLDNGNDKDKEKAKSLRKALTLASERATEGKFDSLIRELTRPDADQSIDVLRQAVADNAAVRKDIQEIIKLLSRDETSDNKEQMDKTAKLLEQIKELLAKQERVRTQTEMGRKNNKELEKDQKKVTKETK